MDKKFPVLNNKVFINNLSTWLSYSPLDSRFAGSSPAGVDGFVQSVKILSMTSFGMEVKLWVRIVDMGGSPGELVKSL